MSIKWIKDADTGELFPVQDDFEYEIPEHLKTAECNHIDYEKTTRTTIDELQIQLTAAQNEIAAIQQEREVSIPSDNESCNEIVSIKHFDLKKFLIIFIVTVAITVFAVFACKIIITIVTNDININTSYSAEYQVQEQDQEQQAEQDTEDNEISSYISSIIRLGALIGPIFVIKIALGFVMRTVRDC